MGKALEIMAVETQHVHLQDDGWGIPVTGFLHGELRMSEDSVTLRDVTIDLMVIYNTG